MSHTLQTTLPTVPGERLATLGFLPAAMTAWRWLMNEKQMATDVLLTEEFEDTQWQDTQYVSGSVDVPLERFGAN